MVGRDHESFAASPRARQVVQDCTRLGDACAPRLVLGEAAEVRGGVGIRVVGGREEALDAGIGVVEFHLALLGRREPVEGVQVGEVRRGVFAAEQLLQLLRERREHLRLDRLDLAHDDLARSPEGPHSALSRVAQSP